MGTYIYGLQADKIGVRYFDGTVIEVYPCRYLYKASFHKSKSCRLKEKRAEQNFTTYKPNYFGLVHDREWEGVSVYDGLTYPVFSDGRKIAGSVGDKKIGYLERRGKAWHLATTYTEHGVTQFAGLRIPYQTTYELTDGQEHIEQRFQTSLGWISPSDFSTLQTEAMRDEASRLRVLQKLDLRVQVLDI